MCRIAIPLCLALLLATRAAAIVIHGGTGTQNFSAPTAGEGGDPGFANVGDRGVYLGNYGGNFWVLTATHVGAGNIFLNGSTRTFVGGSAVTVLNGDNSATDLTLYRISTDPGLPTLNLLSGSNPTASSVVRMVGDGRTEGSSTFTGWGITVNPGANDDTWAAGAGSDQSGYTTIGNTLGVRWGDSIVGGNTSYNVGTGNTSAFFMSFTNTTGNSMGQVGDSGGATFHFSSGTWHLAGILGANGIFGSGQSPDNQPANTAVFGNVTIAASIPSYYSFIITAIPEPSAYAGIAGLMVLVLAFARRKSARWHYFVIFLGKVTRSILSSNR